MHQHHPSFREALRFWVRLGFISFGGPSGQIAIMHQELVERRKWISNGRFLHALNYCMLLPGPEATQLAIYIGWLLHRTWGGIVAGALFVVPAIFILWALSYVYVAYGTLAWVAAIFSGLKPAVVAIVAAAVLRIGKKALRNSLMWLIAAGAFLALFVLHAPFPLVILIACLTGFVGGRIRPDLFKPERHGHGGGESAVLADSDRSPAHTLPSGPRAIRQTLIGLALWWGPVFAAKLLAPGTPALYREGIFFSKAAMVTFGGAYAVLPYVAQRAVEHHQWLTAGQMIDGLGLAETTPGPLIMVLQFVGFMGGWNQPGPLPPLGAATLGALMTTWVTFVPCFLWIFLGAPYIERLRENRDLGAALSAVTAAVVGVVLNLAIWFGAQVLFPGRVLNLFGVVLAAVVFIGMSRWKWGIVPVVLGSALAGLARWLILYGYGS
ncbi:MAG: chromate efflux transporter [Verrucomicrobiae bacterium]|nr:chromate efflux transporter [Verrucomicrobiae bacterium]